VKRRKTVSKHDLIRTIRLLSGRLSYLESIVDSLGDMFRGYVEFMENDKEYIKFMEKKDEEEEDS
tara:strand:- start:1894 stop:2088 length:195 start_codon:yes stop_codon:yes gene_type:complete